MKEERKRDILGIFFTNDNENMCDSIPELKDCKELKSQYKEQVHNKGRGCKSCRKKSLINKFSQLIKARLL
jgi:hypothetical protein